MPENPGGDENMLNVDDFDHAKDLEDSEDYDLGQILYNIPTLNQADQNSKVKDTEAQKHQDRIFGVRLAFMLITCGLIYLLHLAIAVDRNYLTTSVIACFAGMFGFATVDKFRK
jgi:hypothetical protein